MQDCVVRRIFSGKNKVLWWEHLLLLIFNVIPKTSNFHISSRANMSSLLFCHVWVSLFLPWKCACCQQAKESHDSKAQRLRLHKPQDIMPRLCLSRKPWSNTHSSLGLKSTICKWCCIGRCLWVLQGQNLYIHVTWLQKLKKKKKILSSFSNTEWIKWVHEVSVDHRGHFGGNERETEAPWDYDNCLWSLVDW